MVCVCPQALPQAILKEQLVRSPVRVLGDRNVEPCLDKGYVQFQTPLAHPNTIAHPVCWANQCSLVCGFSQQETCKQEPSPDASAPANTVASVAEGSTRTRVNPVTTLVEGAHFKAAVRTLRRKRHAALLPRWFKAIAEKTFNWSG